MKDIKDKVIPEQKTGKKTDVESTETLETLEDAKALFETSKKRLLNINNWGEVAGEGGAAFQLTDKEGNEVERQVAQVGDFFKIDIPGPGSSTGKGFDWVQIENIEDTKDDDKDEIVAIRVRPASNPNNSKDDTAHFFTNEATSSFVVYRKGKTVTAGVHGRNEKPNTEANSAIDQARNAMVALGAMLGFSDVQWKSLVKGILGK